jgi:hypothetical protein
MVIKKIRRSAEIPGGFIDDTHPNETTCSRTDQVYWNSLNKEPSTQKTTPKKRRTPLTMTPQRDYTLTGIERLDSDIIYFAKVKPALEKSARETKQSQRYL